MVLFDPSNTALKQIIRSINATTLYWNIDPIPSKWIFVNGSLPNGTEINGYLYNGTAASVPNTTIIQRKEIQNVGTLPLNSFVYLMISVAVIAVLLSLPNCNYIL